MKVSLCEPPEVNSAPKQGPGNGTIPWTSSGKNLLFCFGSHSWWRLGHLQVKSEWGNHLHVRTCDEGSVPVMSHNFEKWSDNMHNVIVRTLKCLIVCRIVGLMWGRAETDRKAAGRERRKHDGGRREWWISQSCIQFLVVMQIWSSICFGRQHSQVERERVVQRTERFEFKPDSVTCWLLLGLVKSQPLWASVFNICLMR